MNIMPKKTSKGKSFAAAAAAAAAADRAAEKSAERAREERLRREAEEARREEERDREQEEEESGDEGESIAGGEEEEEEAGSKVSCSFPSHKEDKLVEFFAANDCFYNKASPKYQNQAYKAKLIHQIAAELNTTSKYPFFHVSVCACL